MKIFFNVTYFLSFIGFLVSCNQIQPGANTFILDASVMKNVKQSVDLGTSHEIISLIKKADEAMEEGPFSVTFKTQLPPSGDKQDYTTQGPYWWPDPDTEDGLPYIRRDGEVNPEFYEYTDRQQFESMISAVRHLSLAYFFTHEEKYASHATELLKVFFLDETTRMNPHLKYAQKIPGLTEGRGIGIIDVRTFTYLPDVIQLIKNSEAWNDSLHASLISWISEYLQWLLSSEHGRESYGNGNNHTTWYYAQTIALSLLTDQKQRADSLAKAALPAIIDKQIAADGSQPHELRRTLSWGYSVMNLVAMYEYALLSEYLGFDVWQYKNEAGAGLNEGLEFLAQYIDKPQTWPYEQIKELDPSRLKYCLHIASLKYNTPAYKRSALKLDDGAFHIYDLAP
ncbi:MAG: alginate lyase family protein [Cyclobacteriaceae bacterium]|nr:alginate lyase family protein [Cyclobacteriaceae bacterium]